MKAFVFSLQVALDCRESAERAIESALAAAIREADAARRRRKMFLAFIRKEISAVESFGGKRVAKGIVADQARYIERLQHESLVLSQLIVTLDEKVESVRNRLHKAVRERKTLEQLKETERVKWSEEYRRMEQKTMDEISMHRHIRRVPHECAVEKAVGRELP